MAKDAYFSRLGLGEHVSQEEIEARYQEVSAFLRSESVPASLRRWAEEQWTAVDEAYMVLTSPEEAQPRPAAARPGTKRSDHVVVEDIEEEDEEELLGLDDEEAEERREAQRRARQTQQRRAAARRRGADDDDLEPADESVRLKQIAIGVTIGLVVLVGFFAIRQGWIPGTGSSVPQSTQSQQGGQLALDQNRVNQLKAALSKNPNDQDALFELGEIYFEANMWQDSLDALTKVVELDPKNTSAWTDIGTANFNMGRYDLAKSFWQKTLDIDPSDPQAHFNMGFLYANVPPQDLGAAIKEWETVANLAPNSDIAKTAKAHAEAYKKMLSPTTTSPTSSTTTSPSASGSALPPGHP